MERCLHFSSIMVDNDETSGGKKKYGRVKVAKLHAVCLIHDLIIYRNKLIQKQRE